MKQPKSLVTKTNLRKVSKEVDKEIRANSVGTYGRGLAAEGYAGGYWTAIQDVLLAMAGVLPNSNRRYWEDALGPTK